MSLDSRPLLYLEDFVDDDDDGGAGDVRAPLELLILVLVVKGWWRKRC